MQYTKVFFVSNNCCTLRNSTKTKKNNFNRLEIKYRGKKFVRQLSSPPNDPLYNIQPLAWIFLWIWLKCEHQGKRELLKPPLSVVRGRMWWWATANNYCNSIARWFQSETLVNISLMSFAHAVFQLLEHAGIYSSFFLSSVLFGPYAGCVTLLGTFYYILPADTSSFLSLWNLLRKKLI